MDNADYARLSPDLVLSAIESVGFLCDARIMPLNSYENRVYHVGIEDQEPIIAKFYRPGRWSNDQILEEHTFCHALAAQEIPVIEPLVQESKTLFEYQGYRFSLYPRRGGHAPELDNLDILYRLGQQLGRTHAIGQTQTFSFRPSINIQSFGLDPRSYILQEKFIPDALAIPYSTLTEHLLEKITSTFDKFPYKQIRLHGDCHPGNILVRYDSLYLVDLDDARNGPAVQDIWMLLSGEHAQKTAQLAAILEGYEEFHDFDYRELNLIEPLRTLRMLHYAGWLAKRWSDPAFPLAFPWFNSEKYWAGHILELREQLAALNEEPLTVHQ